jgi:xanthine dehydrogenase accessory factor
MALAELIGALERWRAAGEPAALATAGRGAGAAPRRPGARVALARSGESVGAVSAGCVDRDVFECARRVLATGRAELAHYGLADEMGFAVGLSCGGSLDVLVEPWRPGPAWRAAADAVRARRAVALAIGVEPEALRGRALARDEDGRAAGGLDAELDAHAESAARALLHEGGARRLELPWRGSAAEILVEAIAPRRRWLLVGATPIAAALCRLAHALGDETVVIDPRRGFAVAERFPDAERLLAAWPETALAELGLDRQSYVVTLAHDRKFDVPALACALRSPAAYVGALGSARTHARRLAELREQGFAEAELARIHAPVGLDLGGREPEEIALSVLAELQALRHGRDALLRRGAGPRDAAA